MRDGCVAGFAVAQIWDFAGWKKEFWRVHRWPLKMVCGLTYGLAKSFGALMAFVAVFGLAIGYGYLLHLLMKKSWEWGVTQASSTAAP